MKTPRTPWPHAPLHPEGRLSFHVLCARDLLILFCRHGLVTSRTAKQARVIPNRSEEHTSELQSHSFISYAVFCLKKKNNNIPYHASSSDIYHPDSLTHHVRI